MNLKLNFRTDFKSTDTDSLLFFALANIYPEKSDTELIKMLSWAKRRLSHHTGRKARK